MYNNLPKSIQIQITSFLDIDTLANISKASPKNIEQESFLSLVKVYYFISKCLNKTDRSLYYNFYDELQFKKLQINHIGVITEMHFKSFEECYFKYNKVICELSNLINEDIVQSIQNSLYDPKLALPKLRRQNVGMYCNSPFQYFLTDIKYGMDNQEEIPQALQQLKNRFQLLQSKHFQLLVQILNKNKDNIKLIKQMRLTPYIINSQNMQQYYIKQHQLHNLLVSLFAVTDLLISSSQIYVNSIKDPYHQFVEFNLRYNIFRNFVLEIQQKFSFAFQMYGEFYQEIFQQGIQIPKYSFWRPAMTKWIQKMGKFHQQNQKVYNHLVTKLRSQQIKKKLNQICKKQPQIYKQSHVLNFRPIRNKLEFNQYQMITTDQLYNNCPGKDVQQYFQNNPEYYQILAFQYVEYIVDLSVNQHTVHWSGHSQHALEQPYKQFQAQFMEYNQSYLDYLAGIVGQGGQKYKPFKQLLTNQVFYFSRKFVKPVTLNQFIKLANKTISKKKNENKMIDENLENIVTVKPVKKDGNQQNFISYDFDYIDAKLRYFNEKAEILQQIAQDDRCFYSIYPLCSAEKILQNSVDTRNSDNSDDSIQDLGDYLSQEDNQSINMQYQNQKMEKNIKQMLYQKMQEQEQYQEYLQEEDSYSNGI